MKAHGGDPMRLVPFRHLVLIHKLPELYGGNYCGISLR